MLQREPFKTTEGTLLPASIASLREQLATEKDPARKAAISKELAESETLRSQLMEIRPTPPNVTYATKMTLYKGTREIQLRFFGRGDTAGDIFVYLPKERIIWTGDMEEGARVAYMGNVFSMNGSLRSTL